MTDPAEDKSQWTEGRLQEEVARLLPAGTFLASSFEESAWVLRLVREIVTDGQKREEALWEVEHFDKRQALFEVYGRLWLASQTPSGTWSPTKPRPTPATVTRHVVSGEPDVEDLDPVEIASVYEKPSA